MNSHKRSEELGSRQKGAEPSDEETEADESELDECDLDDEHDGRWDVFILDDDGEPLPEYGDFWFPD